MPSHCLECGARWHEPDACTQRFNRFLALEFSDPAYGAVHHLTVPAYMLQHPSQLSKAGWRAMRGLLGDFLDSGQSPKEVRRRHRGDLDSGNRSWSLKKGARLQLPADHVWMQTILDVPDATAADYCAGVERWARQVLEDSAVLQEEKKHD